MSHPLIRHRNPKSLGCCMCHGTLLPSRRTLLSSCQTSPPGLATGKARFMPGLELASGKPSALPVPAHLGEDSRGPSRGPGGAGGDAAGQQGRQGCS